MRVPNKIIRSFGMALFLLVGALAQGTLLSAEAATFYVNSTADPGNGVCNATECTLREAIDAANSNSGVDTIAFDIPGAGPYTIQPLSPLPEITDRVVIDGTTQSGFTGIPIIELDGTLAEGTLVDGLTISAGQSIIKGLVINRFHGDGIVLRTLGNNEIKGNFIGTDVTGTVDLGNSSSGIFIWSTSDNAIGGTTAADRNIISGNGNFGVRIYAGSTGNLVQGNYIGTDLTGTSPLGNSDGVHINLGDDKLFRNEVTAVKIFIDIPVYRSLINLGPGTI